MADLNVEIWDATGNKKDPATLPDDMPISKIITGLVRALKLPVNGPDGQPLSYKLHHKNSGKQLLDTQSLRDASVRENDILRLQPEITAGFVAA